MRHSDSGNVNYILYTLALVFLLPNIVVISLIPDINVSAISVKSREPLRILDMVFISPLVGLPKNQVQALLHEIYNLQSRTVKSQAVGDYGYAAHCHGESCKYGM